MYTDISTVNKMFPSPSMAARPPFGYPGQAQYFGNGSDGKMPYALTFTGFPFGPHLGLDSMMHTMGPAAVSTATATNGTANANPDPSINVSLENEDLWKRFHEIGTEMIITKMGRRMFPTLKTTVSGLDPDKKYYILLDLMLADDCRYKFTGKEWTVAGKAEPQMPPRFFIHPDSPATGSTWMKHDISFQKVKLTNNNLDQNGHIILTSMHKYVARVHVVQCNDLMELQFAPYNTFVFRDTEFLGVTAYQNERITQLKIDNNPFAKGFRENGQLRAKRKGSIDEEIHNFKRSRNGSGSDDNDQVNDEVFQKSSPMMKKLELDGLMAKPSLPSPPQDLAIPSPYPFVPPPPPHLPPSPSLYYHQMLAARYQLLSHQYQSLYHHNPITSAAASMPMHPAFAMPIPQRLSLPSMPISPTDLSSRTPSPASTKPSVTSTSSSTFLSDYGHLPTTPSTPLSDGIKPAFPFSPLNFINSPIKR